jgi:hypothetical protein
MKKILTILLLGVASHVMGQQYNNEWINFNQTYYKFKVGSDGLYRLSQSVLASAGLGSSPIQNLQIWRNGQPVPFYSTVTSGPLGPSDYVEFWGLANDGVPDRPLYRDTLYQHVTKNSLETDTAVYFITFGNSPSNSMITQVANNVAANTLPVEPYFWYKDGKYFKEIINWGFAAVVGEYVYSSSYDKGEFWSTDKIYSDGRFYQDQRNNLYLYPSGPNAKLKFGAAGTVLMARRLAVTVNGTQLLDTAMDYFNDLVATLDVPLSVLNTTTTNIIYKCTAAIGSDRIVLSHSELSYPRQFNFGAAKNFSFELPAKSQGYYLEISNFNAGSSAPVLYDLTNNVRYVGDIGVPGLVRFALPPSSTNTQYVLVSEDATNIGSVSSLTSKNFINFSNPSNQGDYLIISHPLLYGGANGTNPVDDYKTYRRSVAGGNYNAQVYNIDELVDQFAFGIKKHPLSIKNFIRFAREKFASPPKFVLLIGHGLTYYDYRTNESDPLADKLNIIPTFGYPGSDNKLSSVDAVSSIATVPIGRLSVVFPSEIASYLQKVKEYEANQKNAPQTIAGRDWMKNVMHVTGASDPYLGTVLCNYMDAYRDLITDTLTGAKIFTFCKTSADPIEHLSNEHIAELFEEGLSVITYFGHSSATTLEFNLDDPQNYNNPGKYPVFFVNGCNAGNFFSFDPVRFTFNESLSEKFTFADERGGIGFVASTHFGIVNYLNIYISSLYIKMAKDDYGKSVGELQRDALQRMVDIAGVDDYYARTHAEQITLNGDPSLKLNFGTLPDYVMEEPEIQLSPAFISVAESQFTVKVKMINIGRSVSDSIRVLVKRQYPDGSTGTIFSSKIPGIRYSDSLILSVPIVATRDKGLNRITVTLDADNVVVEASESNNTASKDVFIYEDEARPIYPYNYAIITDQSPKLYASTANPLAPLKQYVLEMDTTALFNSSMKISKNLSSVGGILEFLPGVSLLDSVVYYWRVSLVPAPGDQYHWNVSSFMYKSGNQNGFNQSHFYQHTVSTLDKEILDSASRQWSYTTRSNEIIARNGVFPTAANQADHFSITVNGVTDISSVCGVSNIIFNVFNPVTVAPWFNAMPGDPSKYGSDPVCGPGRRWNFQFNLLDTAKRRKIVEFMDLIPDGYYVVVRNTSGTDSLSNTYPSDWIKDTSYLGHNNSMYHRLLAQGFVDIDSFNRPRAFLFAYQKNRPAEFAPKSTWSIGIYDRIQMNFDYNTPDTSGYMVSPMFGPAKTWKQLQWAGTSLETPSTDNVRLDIIGVDNNQVETPLYEIDPSTSNFDLSSVDAKTYPYLKLKMTAADTIYGTPYQLKYWRLLYDPVPEGGVAPNIFFTSQDTLEIGQKFDFGVAFKNISPWPFDSLRVRCYVLDQNNVQHNIDLPKVKPLVSGDTVKVLFQVDTKYFPGLNVFYIEVNPNFDQPEQYHFNNFVFRNVYVRPDLKNPLMDVTFDGIHILNRDIVSSKPHIQIKLTDESKYSLLTDTSLVTVQVRYPDANGTLKTFNFGSDTLKFIPATSGANNTATIDFGPYFPQIMGSNGAPLNPDGDDYELIVHGKDESGNKAGNIEYRVTFRVIDKPMISNLLNYPNPFTTSTAFVFTLTGSEVPQNMKIQILTVTGKIVREITREELGPIRIGRNITEFKWDGTDQFGQKLANGVYLYRFVTSLHGKTLEKYTASGDNTDKFFNNGYGKMYLMR